MIGLQGYGGQVMHAQLIAFQKLNNMYPLIYDWLTKNTLGDNAHKSYFQYYDKNLWLPVRDMIISIRNKAQRTAIENEFLSCVYTGKIFRIHTYNERKKGHIYPLGCYQSWTTEEGLTSFSKHHGKKLLICGYADEEDVAINTFSLLCFIFKHLDVSISNEYYNPDNLCCYEEEKEIVVPIKREKIYNVVAVDSEHLAEWKSFGEILPNDYWFRNNMN